jgi:membrane protein required for colicin V production
MSDLTALDSVALGVFAIAVVRGVFIGLIREGFSIAALGGGLVSMRYAIEPVASVIRQVAGGVGETASQWIAGAAIGIAVVAVIGVVGKKLRQGAQAVGLGWADRIAGGVIGAVEGTLVAAVIVVAATWVAGADSPIITESRSVEFLEELQTYLADHRDELPAVAAPPGWLSKP